MIARVPGLNTCESAEGRFEKRILPSLGPHLRVEQDVWSRIICTARSPDILMVAGVMNARAHTEKLGPRAISNTEHSTPTDTRSADVDDV